MASKQDRLKMLWEPATVLPAQLGPPHQLTPEQRLCWAVFEEVVKDLARPEPRFRQGARRTPRPSLRALALRYIYADDHYWAFSFDNVCAQIGIVPEAFRAAIEQKGLAA